MVSIKDVAKHCGTSISTVSNVINGTKYVSPELELRIRTAISELGYEVNPVARSLKSKRSYTVGVIITNVDRIFFTRVIRGIQDVLTTAGYRLTVCSSNDSLEAEQSFFRMLCGNWADGIIVDTVADSGQAAWFGEMAGANIQKRKIPVIGLETRMDAFGMDSVGIDNRQAAMDATSMLLQAGCRRIAHIAGVSGSPLAQERLEGFEAAAGECACAVEPGDFSPNSGYLAMVRMLNSGARPDGLFAANDQMAVGAIHALLERNLRIPEDIKVAGFDDTFVASLIKPTLSTVHVPKYRMGVQAAGQLLARMGGDGSEARHIVLPYELRGRQTTGCEEPGAWDFADW